jgi:formate dehydrogenase major subunit
MLLTRKSTVGTNSAASAAQARLARGLQGVLAKTMDRRTFLKRSGITAGAAAASLTAASQLPYSMIGTAEAKGEEVKVEVNPTVCTHC